MSIKLEKLPDWAMPERVLNPELQPEAEWAKALTDKDRQAAADSYIRVLRDGPPLFDAELCYVNVSERVYGNCFGHQGGHDYRPDLVVNRHYIGVYGIEHAFKGKIDWLYDPTKDWGRAQTNEWQVQFNRHYQWVPLARAWAESGDVRYAQAFEEELRSWITSQCPAPARKDMSLPGTWRTIEAGVRGGWTWPFALEVFRQCPDVSDEALWLMVAAYDEHGRYLLYSPTGCNFKTMENIALAHAGMILPGLRDKEVFASTALDRTLAEMERQFYDDGLQVELAPSYGILSACCTYVTMMLARQKGLDTPRETRLPRRVWKRLEHLMSVYTRFAAPDGDVPRFHDSNRVNSGKLFAEARLIPGAELPSNPPFAAGAGTDHLPWAGYGVLRQDGRYGLLDAGPWGAGHQHADALQVITWADGGYWLIDPGKPIYDKTDLTRHIRSSAGHNVVLLDGRPHRPDPQIRHTEYPLPMAVCSAPGIRIAAASRSAVNEGGEAFRHERLLLDLNGTGWLVIDFVETDAQLHSGWEWLWHFAPDVALSVSGEDAALAGRGDGRECWVVAAASSPIELAALYGQEKPLRGWAISSRKRDKTPLPVLQATGGHGCRCMQAATLFANESIGLKWESERRLIVGTRSVELERPGKQVTMLRYQRGHVELPPHHLEG